MTNPKNVLEITDARGGIHKFRMHRDGYIQTKTPYSETWERYHDGGRLIVFARWLQSVEAERCGDA